MRRSFVCGLAALSMILVLAIASTPTEIAGYSGVGVKPGDWARYSWSYTQGTRLPDHGEYLITIIGANGSAVTFNETDYDTNGTVGGSFQSSLDLSQPLTFIDSGAMWDFSLIATGLVSGDPINQGSEFVINSTQTMIFAGAHRSCNICYVTLNYDYAGSQNGFLLWDQATGVFLGENMTFQGPTLPPTHTLTINLTATDMWSTATTATTATTAIMAGVAIAAAAAVVLVVASIVRKKFPELIKKKRPAKIGLDVRKSLLSSPKELVADISTGYKSLAFTKVFDTYIMENTNEYPLRVDLARDGKPFLASNVAWIGDKEGGGVSICLDNKQILYPAPENVKNALFRVGKKVSTSTAAGILEIEVVSNSHPCAVCDELLETMDGADYCPACGALLHRLHDGARESTPIPRAGSTVVGAGSGA